MEPLKKENPLTMGRGYARDLDSEIRREDPASAAHQVSQIAAQTTR
jgi:hypothetical protein